MGVGQTDAWLFAEDEFTIWPSLSRSGSLVLGNAANPGGETARHRRGRGGDGLFLFIAGLAEMNVNASIRPR
jgi:hypothetical protein